MSEYLTPPYDRYCVVECEAEEQRTAGGLILGVSPKAETDIRSYRVVSVGPGAWGYTDRRQGMMWKVGDVLLAHEINEVQSYMWRGGKVYVLVEGDVLAGPSERADREVA